MLYWLQDTIVNFITFWKKNRKHKSKSFVPDVRTKRYSYLISIRDMCFECETLVSLPRWALDLICAIYVRLLYACSSQMGPRWSSIFSLEESEEFTGFLYLKARVIFFRALLESAGNIGRKRPSGRLHGASFPWATMALFSLLPYSQWKLLLKASVLMAEAVS